MDEIALHILDLIENSIDAGARRIEVTVNEDLKRDILEVIVKDDGRGMGEDEVKKVDDPFFTTKDKETGLGISLLKQSAIMAGGNVEIRTRRGEGTEVRAYFIHSHIDRQPLGDVEKSIAVAASVHPDVELLYRRKLNGAGFEFYKKSHEKINFTEIYGLLRNKYKELRKSNDV